MKFNLVTLLHIISCTKNNNTRVVVQDERNVFLYINLFTQHCN